MAILAKTKRAEEPYDLAVNCAGLLKKGKCDYWNSTFCPLNIDDDIREGVSCIYANIKK